ncbi:MAG: hypothetical protein GY739_05320, partial [Mesoflavibacter sp.]|nr:hypothetical protein [Mesoflavibacter sp.]
MQVPLEELVKTAKKTGKSKSQEDKGRGVPQVGRFKPIPGKLERQKQEQGKALIEFPTLDLSDQKLLHTFNWAKEVEDAGPTTIHTYNAWIFETGRQMVIDSRLENFGLPEFTNTIGLDDLKLQSFTVYPGLMDIGHGYHLTTNPSMVLGWVEQRYTQLP